MTHLYGQVPSMVKMLTDEEHTSLEQEQSVGSAIPSPLELKLTFPD